MKLHWHLPSFPPFKDRFHTLTNLTGNSYFGIVVLGVAIALYGSLSFLFSWMPHEWIQYDEDGNAIWTAEALSTVGAFFGMIGLLGGLENTSDKLSKLQIRAAKSVEFEKLIKRELNQFGWIVRDPEMAAKVLRTLELEIRDADKKRLIYNEDAGYASICWNLSDGCKPKMRCESLGPGDHLGLDRIHRSLSFVTCSPPGNRYTATTPPLQCSRLFHK